MPERVTVRDADPGDRSAIEAVVAAAFGDSGGKVVDVVRALHRAGHVLADQVAVDAGEVVGHVQLDRSWLDARRSLVEVAVLSPLSVRPDRQGAGIGTLLLDAAVGRARELGVPMVVLEGSPGYYGSRGWRAARELGVLRPSERIPEPALQAVPLAGLEAWMTGRLIYCEAFWAEDAVGLRDPELAQVEQMFD